MKKKSLISLSSLLLASALLVGCGSKTSNQQVESKEEPQVAEPSEDSHNNDESNSGSRSNGVEKCHIHIDLHGTSLKTGSTKQTDFVTRSGTLWNLLSNLAPAKDDIVIPGTGEGVTYNIKSIAYSFDKEGTDIITPSDAIRSDTNLFLQIEHDDPETGVQVLWNNDVSDPGALGIEKYAIGEIPFYAGPTPKSAEDPSQTFTGWLPAVSPIKAGDTQRIYVAQYEKIGVDCMVTYDYNYKIDDSEVVDIRYVKQGECAEPLDPKPVRHNYSFQYWCKDKECTTKYNFDEPIIDNLTRVYAYWIPDLAELKIDPNGGTFNDNTTASKTIDSHYGATWGEIKNSHTEIGIKTAPAGYKIDGYKYEYYDVKTATWTEIPNDNFVIKTNLSIKVTYTQEEATLTFADAYDSGAIMPGNKTIKYGTKWSEIKYECMPTGDITEGFTFDHYYIDNGTEVEPTIITDDYVFTTGTVTLNACWDITVHFRSDIKIGVVPYEISHLLTGEKWVNVKDRYNPTIVDPTIYQFDKYTTNDDPSIDVTDTYVFTKPVILTAHYKGTEADNFVTDSWETFTSYISSCQTFQQITATGAPYWDEYMSTEGGKESETFVGLTRTVNVFGKDYTVRVIDDGKVGSSTIAHGHFFTFEFTNLLDLEIPYSIKASNNYKDSYINNYLNNTFFYALPTALQNAIKPTNAKYYDASVTDPTQRVKEDLNAKLFILSASELGFTKFPDYDIDVTEEGTYAYYKAGTDKKKTLLNQTAYVNYWTRSADVSGTTETAWNVNQTGTLGVDNYPIEVGSSGVYIAPVFEIR